MGLEPGFRYTFSSKQRDSHTVTIEFARVATSDLSEYRLTIIEYEKVAFPLRLKKQLEALKKAPFVGNIGMVQNGLWSIMRDFDEHGWKMTCAPLDPSTDKR